MNVLLVAPSYPSPENKHAYGFVHSRAKIYSEKGLSIQVYTPSKTSNPLTYTYENIKVFKGHHSFLGKIIKDFDPDVIAVHAPSPSTLTYINRFRKPTIVWIHGAEVLITSFHDYMAPLGIRYPIQTAQSLFFDVSRNLMLRKALKKADAIVYVSKWMQKMTEKYLMMKHPRTFIIPNPVNAELFKPNKMDDAAKITEGVSVRALEWKYGLDIAIKAFTHSKISLTIVGKGSLETYLKNLAEKVNANVKFITEGIDHNLLPTFYQGFGFFVAPSRTEAQGVAMCEAMACGLPVIATNIGGIPEFVFNEYNGLLVPPEDPKALRQAVMKLVSNNSLYDSLSQNARKFVINNLSHELVFNRELKVFKMATNEAKE